MHVRRSARSRRLPTSLAIAAAAVGTAGMALPQAAQAFYRASADTTVNLRNCDSTQPNPPPPSTTCRWVQTVGPGTPLDIFCQMPGQTIGNNPFWDQLTGGQWVADYYVNGTNDGRSPWINYCLR
jgi:hypothetical protein